MSGTDRRDAEAAVWAGRLVILLATFWTFVLALGAAWLVDRARLLSGAAFDWTLRLVAAAATVAAFLLAPRLARRAGSRALPGLALATGLSLAFAVGFLFVVFVVRPG